MTNDRLLELLMDDMSGFSIQDFIESELDDGSIIELTLNQPNGDTHILKCCADPEIVGDVNITTVVVHVADDSQVVWDIETGEWYSFRYDDVSGIG